MPVKSKLRSAPKGTVGECKTSVEFYFKENA